MDLLELAEALVKLLLVHDGGGGRLEVGLHGECRVVERGVVHEGLGRILETDSVAGAVAELLVGGVAALVLGVGRVARLVLHVHSF